MRNLFIVAFVLLSVLLSAKEPENTLDINRGVILHSDINVSNVKGVDIETVKPTLTQELFIIDSIVYILSDAFNYHNVCTVLIKQCLIKRNLITDNTFRFMGAVYCNCSVSGISDIHLKHIPNIDVPVE